MARAGACRCRTYPPRQTADPKIRIPTARCGSHPATSDKRGRIGDRLGIQNGFLARIVAFDERCSQRPMTRGVAPPTLGQRPVPVGHVRPGGFGVPEQDQPPGDAHRQPARATSVDSSPGGSPTTPPLDTEGVGHVTYRADGSMKLIAVARITVWPSVLTASTTVLTMPRSGLLSDRRDSATVARTRSVSPGRTGSASGARRGRRCQGSTRRTGSSPPASASREPAVCQPLAISPPYGPPAAATGSTWKRLRIEFLSESNDARLIDADASALVRRPGHVVLEVAQPVFSSHRSIAAPAPRELQHHR